MKEDRGNLWTYPADAVVITTNGTIKNNGTVVMGRGCAKEARDKFDGLDRLLGEKIMNEGNNVHFLVKGQNKILISFPVKHNYWEQADLSLIERSAHQLVHLIDSQFEERKNIVLPRPGSGNGGRDWETEVKPILSNVLDSRFTCVTF